VCWSRCGPVGTRPTRGGARAGRSARRSRWVGGATGAACRRARGRGCRGGVGSGRARRSSRGQLLHLVGGVAALEMRAQCPDLDGLGQDHRVDLAVDPASATRRRGLPPPMSLFAFSAAYRPGDLVGWWGSVADCPRSDLDQEVVSGLRVDDVTARLVAARPRPAPGGRPRCGPSGLKTRRRAQDPRRDRDRRRPAEPRRRPRGTQLTDGPSPRGARHVVTGASRR